MLFNSLHFLFFFPVVVGVYFIIFHRFRWIFLLTASYYFYMCWKVESVVLIMVSTLVDYFSALGMERAKGEGKRRLYLFLSLTANLGLLFMFKYFNFFNDSIHQLFNHFNIFYGVSNFNLLLPVGISFYTFQTLSYSIDVYLKMRPAETHLGYFALYVAFFPQLVAGPIERSTRLLPQFFKKQEFNYDKARSGLLLMLWGFIMKVVIADRLALAVNTVYADPTAFTGVPILIATYFFAIQVFCDFAGYSCIAIGVARIMGIDLMENFKRPYFARSIYDFWNRWHISLTSWFRDYLFIPLSIGDQRKGSVAAGLEYLFCFSCKRALAWGLVAARALGSHLRKKSADFFPPKPENADRISG